MGYVIVHEESLSIPDYYTVNDADGKAIYRPTCHYAYHPCNDAILSLHEVKGTCIIPEKQHILTAEEIVSGSDDLGVLLYGHAKGAMWFGTRLSNDEAVKLAPALDAVIRHRLKIVAVANGQRVPEDWHRLSAQALVHRALRDTGSAAYRFEASEMNLVFASPKPAPAQAPVRPAAMAAAF